MKSMRRHLSATITSLCMFFAVSICSQSQAAMVWDLENPGAAVTIQEIIDADGLSVNGMVFDEWVVESTSPFTEINASKIKVKAFSNDENGGVGLTFIAPWMAGTNELYTTNIEFGITAEKKIKKVDLWATSYAAGGEGGAVSIAENLSKTAPTNPNQESLGVLGVFYKSGDPANATSDSVTFDGTKKMYVHKDISVRGGINDGETGYAHISKFSQYYHVSVPEPAALSLLGLGSLMVVCRRKNRG